MRDICTESVIPVVPSLRDKLIKYLLIGCIVLSVVLFFMAGTIGIISAIVFVCLLYRQLAKTDAEYEYVHTNDVFDVDIVTCNSMRKQLCSINLNHVDIVAHADSQDVCVYGEMKQFDYYGDSNSEELYAMVYTVNSKQQKLLLHMDQQMLKSLKQWIPNKVK